MTPILEGESHHNAVDKKTILQGSIWKPAFVLAGGWVLSNIIIFAITDWFLAGTANIEFTPHLGAALLLGILGLLAGFTMSYALWLSQEAFIGVHALAFTIIVALLTASFAYVPDGIFIMPLLFVGLYIGMKWANPSITVSHIMGSFLVWVTIGAAMGLIVLVLPYTSNNWLLELLVQCLWSGSVGLFGSAFMFWQLNKQAAIQIGIPQDYTKTSAEHWQKVYDAW